MLEGPVELVGICHTTEYMIEMGFYLFSMAADEVAKRCSHWI